MDFAKTYPVRDSMRMMRLLYRLGLGSQQNKHEQVMMFSRTVSALQNKAREQQYKERLEKMENQTLIMLIFTGGGAMAFMYVFSTEFRKRRLLIFFDPWQDALGGGWQIIQSLYAISSRRLIWSRSWTRRSKVHVYIRTAK